MLNKLKIKCLYDTNKTIARDLLNSLEFPWEALSKISSFILELGESLDISRYNKVASNIWISKNAQISNSANITGPCIIEEHTEIRHCAFIRGNAIIGKNCVVGNSTELKNVILFDNVQVPHYNYVGDSILGYRSHMGAGAITSNVKADRSEVKIKINDFVLETGLKKIGAMLGDGVEIGCNAVLNPGTVIGKNSIIYPLSAVRGYIAESHIFKDSFNVVDKQDFR